MSTHAPRTHAWAVPPLNPSIVEGRFEFNGAAPPTVSQVFGTIQSVTQLTSTGGNAFYRIKIGDPDGQSVCIPDLSNRVHISATVEQDIDGGDDMEVRIPSGWEMPIAGGIGANEFDIVILDAGVAVNNVGTGRFFSFSLLFEDIGTGE